MKLYAFCAVALLYAGCKQSTQNQGTSKTKSFGGSVCDPQLYQYAHSQVASASFQPGNSLEANDSFGPSDSFGPGNSLQASGSYGADGEFALNEGNSPSTSAASRSPSPSYNGGNQQEMNRRIYEAYMNACSGS